jgi:hypothetical protein
MITRPDIGRRERSRGCTSLPAAAPVDFRIDGGDALRNDAEVAQPPT